jgi:hypothetical protein
MAMPLSTTEIAYQVVLDSSVDPDPVTSQMDEEDLVLEPCVGHFVVLFT